MERNQLSDGHSQTRGDGERELSGHIIEADYQVVLTSWRTQIEGLVKTQKERKKACKGHSLPGEHRGKVKSEHVKNVQEQREGNNRNQHIEGGLERTD